MNQLIISNITLSVTTNSTGRGSALVILTAVYLPEAAAAWKQAADVACFPET